MIAALDFEQRVRDQQSGVVLYPLELFCRECGKGHLATPGGGSCQDCGADRMVYRRHPTRLVPVRRARRNG